MSAPTLLAGHATETRTPPAKMRNATPIESVNALRVRGI